MSAFQPEVANEGAAQSQLAQISTEMVRLYKEQFGRGPTGARTQWAGDDVLVCILEDTYTLAERNLVQMGEHQRVRETRMFFQYAKVPDFVTPIERITGRTVRAFISGIDTKVDGLSSDMFVLYPEDGVDHISRQHMP